MMELSIAELEAEQSDLLPAREALNHGFFLAIGSGNGQYFVNKSTAVQLLTSNSSNSASSSVSIVNGIVIAPPFVD